MPKAQRCTRLFSIQRIRRYDRIENRQKQNLTAAELENIAFQARSHLRSSKRKPSKELIQNFERLSNFGKIKFPDETRVYDARIEDFKGAKTWMHPKIKLFFHIPSNKVVILKFILLPSRKDPNYAKCVESLYSEVNTLLMVGGHPNIIDMYGFFFHQRHLVICLEKMDGSLLDLYRELYHNIGKFPEQMVGTIGVSVINALNQLRSVNMMHRDIKPGNILYKLSGEIKLADFGWAKIVENSLASSYGGTEIYLPPEVYILNKEKNATPPYNCSRDVWSLGITLLELIYGRLPYQIDPNNPFFQGKIPDVIITTNISALIENCLETHKISQKTADFLKGCLEKEPSNRSKPEGLLNTEFYRHFQKNSNRDYISRQINYVQVRFLFLS